MSATITTDRIELPGGPLAIHRAGDAGPPLLLLHGAMLDTARLLWRNVIPALSDAFQVVAPDWPRHGGSRPWYGFLDQAALASCVDAVLEHCRFERAAIAGLSLGGGVAAGYAAARPDRVSRLVLINPGGMEGRRAWQRTTWLTMRTPGMLRLLTRLYPPARVRAGLARALPAGERAPDFDAIVALAERELRAKREHGELLLDDWQIASYGWSRMRIDHRPLLPRIACPTLLVHGLEDRLVPRASLVEAARLLRDARLVDVEGAGHALPLDRPERLHEEIRAFVAA
ncbi:alpha/beta fold hydrolase [Conexibacter arvalis]|uniref:Pimeloyl-ACP methyl ester carboxylesterase n=1 Tax=Conexibacter arvalis TaxID=912552 RepID=A0A840I8Q5_9ACTN|nr:alpha/beta hydrolase [Conexibacter arvalis]MBB4660651.1 pimeloyl-ACP methyl ester carboxylesterase [Conexibacter arvalis]